MTKKDLSYYLKLKYPITLSEGADGGRIYYKAEIPDLPGCAASGETVEEALRNLEESRKLWLKVSLKKGLSIPEHVSEDEFSGRFLLRIPSRLHMRLTIRAREQGVSLNQFIRTNLEKSVDLEDVVEIVRGLEKKIEALQKSLSIAVVSASAS
ncbi:MAG: type II toxin-antitoxin system HicB family antitoxin, partial [Candidatus Aminicenantales bacterium]